MERFVIILFCIFFSYGVSGYLVLNLFNVPILKRTEEILYLTVKVTLTLSFILLIFRVMLAFIDVWG